MNLVVLFSSILFALFGVYTCAVLPNSTSSSNLEKLDESANNVGRELIGSPSLISEKKLNDNLDDHAGDHDQDQKVKARKGVTLPDDDLLKVVSEAQTNHSISTDRASTTITKGGESPGNKTSEISSTTKSKEKVTKLETASSNASEKNPPSVATEAGASQSSSIISNKSVNTSTSSDVSKSKSKSSSSKPVSTESTSSKSSLYKKPLVTFSVEDDPTLLNVPRVRQFISSSSPLDAKGEASDSPYLPPSSGFVVDRMEIKREMYIFPLVVLIFLVPMVLGVGILILRRVREYWSTRHYRRMDFLVDGMYNT